MRHLLACSVLLVACVSDSVGGDAGPAQGALGGKCFSNGTCNAGLVCVVPDTCVLPDAGAADAPADVTSDAVTDGSKADAGPCPSTGLLTLWNGEGTAADAQGYLDLQEKSGASYTAGHSGQAFSFGGANYLEAAPGAHATLPGLAAITIEAWIDPTSIGSGTILSRRSDAGNGYELRIESGQIVFQIGGFTVKGAATLAAAIPHHVAVTVGTSSMQLYLDGVADGSPFPIASAFQTDVAVVRVGSGWGPAQVTKNVFPGWIDELAVYSNELSASEVAAVFAGGTKCH